MRAKSFPRGEFKRSRLIKAYSPTTTTTSLLNSLGDMWQPLYVWFILLLSLFSVALALPNLSHGCE